MPDPRLYVAFYRPWEGNYTNWALYIDDENESIIFEVLGQHPYFKRNVRFTRPEYSADFLGKEYVGVIRRSDIPYIWNIAASVYVDNETVEWDCQDYVLDILDRLVDEFILNEWDEDYREARHILKWKRGPII
ncbi:hypothetical protein N7462_003393 [Penicillium macrosclerotiorum]|uniref:uncharacterized protein n=1 Tax=Penicillium macrosclerotiorum TaxID=303699 RepID=UPI0025486400|nr:uncharacterized protein N7462_003393 [Penicillium macrosclerotiorum]KAJ5689001.1 hypothetical protein N7462_003393 [Penicillium macrosclerotiorum]